MSHVPAREQPLSSYAHVGYLRWLGLAMLVVWVATLWTLTVAKLATSGFVANYRFFTNWSWSLQMLYYTADLACYVDTSGSAHRVLLGRPYWLMRGVVWIVFWLVFPLFASNGELIEKSAEEAGVSVGVALVFDRFVHVVPAIVESLYTWHRWYGVAHGIWWIRHTKRYGTLNAVAYVVGDVYLLPLAFCALYAIPINVVAVYGIDQWVVWVAPPIALLTLTACSGGVYVIATRHIYHLYPGHDHDLSSSNTVVREMLIEFGYPATHADVLKHKPFWVPNDGGSAKNGSDLQKGVRKNQRHVSVL